MTDPSNAEPGSTPIVVLIFPDPAAWLRENYGDLSIDSVAAVVPMDGNLGEGVEYADKEQGKSLGVKSMADHVKGLRKLVLEVAEGRLYVGGIKNPKDLTDAGNWDVEVVDSFFQLVGLGEVFYG